MSNENNIKNIGNFNPAAILPLIYNKNVDFNQAESIRKVNADNDNSSEIANEIIDNLNLNRNNITSLKFIFHELIANIYDHSKFDTAYVMGKKNENFYEFSFLDNGITIPQSLKNADYQIENDSTAIVKAINGLSSKNELGYVERGTGLNNSINIVTSGSGGEVLILSGCGLVHITKNETVSREIAKNRVDGTLVSVRMNLDSKIDIYNYLKHVKYEAIQ